MHLPLLSIFYEANIIHEKELVDRIILDANYEIYNNIKLNQTNRSEHNIKFTQNIKLEQTIESEQIIKTNYNIETNQNIKLNQINNLKSDQNIKLNQNIEPAKMLNLTKALNLPKILNLLQNDTYVRIQVPPIDRSNTDYKALSCKIVEVLPNDLYHLGCAAGIINKYYSASEMELMGSQEFIELTNIPNISVGVHETALAQSASTIVGIRCNCHTKCDQNCCKCKKAGIVCGSNCHLSNNRCINRDE
ncbi:12170_t:CDS:2 [Cetraspora pellucida]|uniref:12170_t:CDS:1 n=1 Tax=Cetraspora pellucida TaxID=1433469 RepID=A0ACA9JW51_9GLOM|nr:12170_t:CDS:2 [Cetraspora pellucida]